MCYSCAGEIFLHRQIACENLQAIFGMTTNAVWFTQKAFYRFLCLLSQDLMDVAVLNQLCVCGVMEQHCQRHRRSCASTQEITPFISSCIGESGSCSGGNGRSVSPEVDEREQQYYDHLTLLPPYRCVFLMCDFVIFPLDTFTSAHPDTTTSDKYRVIIYLSILLDCRQMKL